MAVGTLAECYNNINLFRGVVKMRRGPKEIAPKLLLQLPRLAVVWDVVLKLGGRAGQSAVHMVGTRSMQDVYTAFHHFAALLADKVGPRIRCKDPSLCVPPSDSSTVAPGG